MKFKTGTAGSMRAVGEIERSGSSWSARDRFLEIFFRKVFAETSLREGFPRELLDSPVGRTDGGRLSEQETFEIKASVCFGFGAFASVDSLRSCFLPVCFSVAFFLHLVRKLPRRRCLWLPFVLCSSYQIRLFFAVLNWRIGFLAFSSFSTARNRLGRISTRDGGRRYRKLLPFDFLPSIHTSASSPRNAGSPCFFPLFIASFLRESPYPLSLFFRFFHITDKQTCAPCTEKLNEAVQRLMMKRKRQKN